MTLRRRIETLEKAVSASAETPRSTMTEEEWTAFVLGKLAEAEEADEVTPWVRAMRSVSEALRSGLLSWRHGS